MKVKELTKPGYKKTKLGWIPNDWKLMSIDEITDRITNRVEVEEEELYREIGIRSHGKGIFHKNKVTGKSLGNKRVFWIEPNCFVVNIVFAWEQAVSKTTEDEIGMIASHRFPMYKPKEDVLILDYLLCFFKTPLGKHLLGLASPGGAGRNKTLGQKDFSKLKIPVPPLEVQVQIVTKIDAWTRSILFLKKIIEEKNKQHLYLSNKLLGSKNNTGNFNSEMLGNLGTTYSGLSGKTKENFGNGKPYIPYKNIFKNSKIDLSYLDYVQIQKDEKQNLALKGDVFFTTSSETPGELGMSSVLLNDIKELYLNSFCFGFRLMSFERILPEYLRFLLRSKEFRKEIISIAQGSTRFNLSKKQLMKVEIHFPSKNEQIKRYKILEQSERELEILSEKLILLLEQKKVLSRQLVIGKIQI